MERITINKNVRGFVKNSAFEVIEKLAKNNNGYITAQMITELNIHRGYLKEMIDMGKIEKITRGVYIIKELTPDKFYALSLRCPRIIYCELTALFLLGIIKECPKKYDIAVNANYHDEALVKNYHLVKCFPNILEIGVRTVMTPFGKEVKCYDSERCICDLIRFKKRFDFKIIKEILNKYMKSKEKDTQKLYEYAKKLRVSKELERIIALYAED